MTFKNASPFLEKLKSRLSTNMANMVMTVNEKRQSTKQMSNFSMTSGLTGSPVLTNLEPKKQTSSALRPQPLLIKEDELEDEGESELSVSGQGPVTPPPQGNQAKKVVQLANIEDVEERSDSESSEHSNQFASMVESPMTIKDSSPFTPTPHQSGFEQKEIFGQHLDIK